MLKPLANIFHSRFLRLHQQSSTPLNAVGNITSALRNQDQIFILCPERFALEMPVCFCGCGSLPWVCVALSVCIPGSPHVLSVLGPVGSLLKCFCYLDQFTPRLCPKLVCSCHLHPCGPRIPLCVCFCLGILFYMRSKHFNGFGITVCCKMSVISTPVGQSISLL